MSNYLKQAIEINEEFRKALDVMENTDKNVFLTGKAGTGKSTLLDYFRENTKKRVIVLAPTGVAALNVKGETIHSFFGFKPDITIHKVKKIGKKNEIYKKTKVIIIDEISMVRADLLDCVDKFLRLNGKSPSLPFGGAQMIFIGDLYQLPPVVTSKEKQLFETYYSSPYFFDSRVMKELSYEFLELDKIYRQKDNVFIDVLNGIRNNSIKDEQFQLLNSRAEAHHAHPANSFRITLTTTNDLASRINQEHLNGLAAPLHSFMGEITGEFDRAYCPTEIELKIKPGAQVMLLNNDPSGRWVNGTIGEVKAIKRKEGVDVHVVKLRGGETVEVKPYTWEIFHFRYDETRGRIESETAGAFRQYPLRLAWAVTIHKSQGKTFENVNVDFGRSVFACGQAYVALSRCTALGGITLIRPLRRNEVFVDWRIVKFMTASRYAISEKKMPLEDKIRTIIEAIDKGASMEIVYLKANDEKSRRVIKPVDVGRQNYLNKEFIGVEAYCTKRKENRMFRIDRILEMKLI